MSHDVIQKIFFFFSFFKILSLPISTLEVFCIYTKASGFVYLWIPECVTQRIFSSISVSCIFSGFFSSICFILFQYVCSVIYYFIITCFLMRERKGQVQIGEEVGGAEKTGGRGNL